MPAPVSRRRAARWIAGILGVGLAAAFLILLASTEWGASFGADAKGERRARMERSPRYDDGRFHNTHASEAAGWGRALGALLEGLDPAIQKRPPAPLPLETPAQLLQRPPHSGLRLTWLGHSTVLIELDGARILTDPIWSERASPSTLVGPSRFHPAPLPLEAIGPLDAVVISHDHYDHLDMATVRRLAATGVPFYAPLGVGAHLEHWGVPAAQITELDWWEEASPGKEIRLVATPSQHFSGRSLIDRNSTLWTSWSLLGPAHRVFFSGDSGLTPEFATIGERLGPFDVAMFEIGAFNEAWADIHLGAAGALEAFRLIGARELLPIHWSTFDLATHAWDEPAEALYRMAGATGASLLTPSIGHPFEPTVDAPRSPWWRQVETSGPHVVSGERGGAGAASSSQAASRVSSGSGSPPGSSSSR